MLDDAPLPERYDTNEVVLMPVDPRTVFAYWEVRQSVYEELRGGREGTLVLRLLAVSASWTGPSIETRDVEIGQLVGDWFVRDLPVGAVLRGAIGFRGAHQFEPLSVAMDVTTPVDSVALVRGGEIAEFTPEGARTVHAFSSSSEHESVRQAVIRARARGRATTRGESVWIPGSSWGALSPAPLPPPPRGAVRARALEARPQQLVLPCADQGECSLVISALRSVWVELADRSLSPSGPCSPAATAGPLIRRASATHGKNGCSREISIPKTSPRSMAPRAETSHLAAVRTSLWKASRVNTWG